MNSFTPEMLKIVEPRFSKLQQAPIYSANETVGWHVNALSSSDTPLGSGCNQDQNTAKIIAISETMERALISQLSRSKDKIRFKLDEVPSSCGFAFGFDSASTKIRALHEAVERWAWSKWIDEGFIIPTVPIQTIEITPLAKHFASVFEQIEFRKIDLELTPSFSIPVKMHLGIVLGKSAGGIFPGSRCCSILDAPWEHAIVEAWRHWLIHKGMVTSAAPQDNVYGRIKFFGDNMSFATEQIDRALKSRWPVPQLALMEELQEAQGHGYLWRALCSDYVPWHIGGPERFVY